MRYCNLPVPRSGRACGLDKEHDDDEPCRPDIICNMCGGSVSMDSGKRRCRSCQRIHGKEEVKMDPKVIDAVTAWRVVYDKIEAYEPILAPLVEEEAKLRKAVIEAAFPDGQENHEGTNNLEIWPGWILKAVVKISRQVDEAAWPAIKEELRKRNVPVDFLIRLKPEVALKVYRDLREDERKVFDQCLVIKPSTPNLQLLPKEGS